MKKLIILAILLAMTGIAQAASIPLVNPGFETGDFTGWTTWQWGGAPVPQVNDIEVLTGDYSGSLKNECGRICGAGAYQWVDMNDLGLTEGDTISFQGYAKAIRNPNCTLVIAFFDYVGGVELSRSEYEIGAHPVWTFGKATGVVPAGARGIKLEIANNNNSGIAHFDDLRVIVNPSLVPDVVGLAQAQAESDIIAADLIVGEISNAHSDIVPAESVISQDPLAGAIVSIGSAVDLVISLGLSPIEEININITPETLNTKSQGRWITCNINALAGYAVADIVKDSIKLAGLVTTQHVQVNPGQQTITVKFDRLIVIDTLILQEGLDHNGGFAVFVDVNVTGEFTDGKMFEGTDTIKFIHNAKPITIHHKRRNR